MHGVPSIVCTMYNDNKQQGHVYCVCSSCFFYIKAVSTRLLTSKGIMYIKARNMVRPFNVKLTAIQSTIENQSAAYRAHSAVYMGRNFPRQHFLALNVTNSGGLSGLQLLDYCIYVNQVKFPRIFGWMARSGCLQIQKILPGNVCRKWLKFPETPGNPNW